MKNLNYMKLLTENISELPAFYELDTLYRRAQSTEGYEGTQEEFNRDLIKFMKTKKVDKFTILNDNLIRVDSFGRYKIYELLKYFKIGKDVTSINAEILFRSWKPEKLSIEAATYEDFIRDFKNMMLSIDRNSTYFMFEKQLTFQKYNR